MLGVHEIYYVNVDNQQLMGFTVSWVFLKLRVTK